MMKKTTILLQKTKNMVLLLGSFLIAYNTYAGWTQLGDISFPGNVAADVRVCFEINGKGYAGTGMDQNFNLKRDFWEYDPSGDTWTQKADFAGSARWFASGFAINGKGYLGTGGGVGGAKLSDFYEYDPVANQWSSRASFGGGLRDNAVGFAIGNKGYIALGASSTSRHNDLWEYDPLADSWMQKSDFPGAARAFSVSFVIAGIAYVGCGYNNQNNPTAYYSDVYAYDPDDSSTGGGGSWTRVADFGGGNRGYAGTFVINGMGYVTGGDYPAFTTDHTDLWKYNPVSNKWLQKEDFPGEARLTPDAFSLNGRGYIGGGFNFLTNTYYSDFYEYTESCDTVGANFIYSEDSTTALTVNFSAEDVFDHTAVYTWDFGDGNTSNTQNPNHAYDSAGVYNVCLTVDNGCSVHTFCTDVSLQNTGVYTKILGASERVIVYPNPAKDYVNLRIPLGNTEGVVIKIFDMAGKEIKSQNSIAPVFRFNIADLAEGVYYLNVYSSNNHRLHSEKIIIRK